MGDSDKKVNTRWDKWGVVFQGVTAVAVPISLIALIIGVFQFKSQQETNAAQALNQQRQTTLDNYLNDISALVLGHNLSEPGSLPAVRALAVARTDTAVRNLDGIRRGILIRYLWDADLIRGKSPVVFLHKANLDYAVFRNAYLYDANLGTDYLVRADFYGADLHGANLSWANLSGADLIKANLGCVTTTQFDVSVRILAQRPAKSIDCADLEHANLSNAHLQDADLIGVNLSQASLDGADLKGARYSVAKIQVTSTHKAIPSSTHKGTVSSTHKKTLAIPATRWPPPFDATKLKEAGAVCVNC